MSTQQRGNFTDLLACLCPQDHRVSCESCCRHRSEATADSNGLQAQGIEGMTTQAADRHGCLVCHSVKRPWRCADCVNQALREKRQFSDEAQGRSETARSALAAALQV